VLHFAANANGERREMQRFLKFMGVVEKKFKKRQLLIAHELHDVVALFGESQK